MNPLVAVILVNYNGEKDTIKCLESLQQLSYSDYMIIVVDNNSNISSKKILREVQSRLCFKLIESEVNGGFAAGNNLGIVYALEKNAEYIVLLNNDTVVEKDFLEKLIEVGQNDPACGICTGTIYYEDERNKVWCAGGSFNPKTFKAELTGAGQKDYVRPSEAQEITFACGCCMCIKAELLKKDGLLAEDFFMYEEDVEFCYRVRKAGWKIYYAPSAVIYHKVSASTGGMKKPSALTQYYTVRNRFLFIRSSAMGIWRYVSYGYSLAMYTYYCMIRYFDLKYLGIALRDFKRNVWGKSDRIL